MVTTQPGGSSDCRDGGSTGEVEEEEEVPMKEEEMDVIGKESRWSLTRAGIAVAVAVTAAAAAAAAAAAILFPMCR